MEDNNKRELIVSTWRSLGAGRVGRRELRAIQNALAKEFGKNAVQSPASIARVLADEAAELKHPEIIEFDAQWRESRVESEARKFKGLEQFSPGNLLSLKYAEVMIDKLEQLRRQFEREGDKHALTHINLIVAEARRAAQALAKDGTLSSAVRAEQSEVATWLSVWNQTPALFTDWLELRRRSPDFRNKFLTKTSS